MNINLFASELKYNMKNSIQIVDESTGKKTSYELLDTVYDQKFKNFVVSISNYISDNIEKLINFYNCSNDNPKIELCFVYRPLILQKAGGECSSLITDDLKSNIISHLKSPWVTITRNRSPMLTLHAVFMWNERQVLIDQALLAGSDIAQIKSNASIEAAVFEKYVEEYANSILLAPTPEAQAEANVRIVERIPADILWLFRQGWQSTHAPFSMESRHTLHLVLERAVNQYIDLSKALFDRCFISKNTNEQFHNIFSLHSIIDINKHKIKKFH